jgi:hypothetical protein
LATVLTLCAGGLLIASGAIHLHLWSSGYSQIATIGPLFLMQGIVSIVLGLAAAAFRRAWAMLIGFAMACGTIAGFLLSVNIGLFGFQDTWDAADAKTAFVVEVISAALFAIAAVLAIARNLPRRAPREKGA